jgi:hypothetical protein
MFIVYRYQPTIKDVGYWVVTAGSTTLEGAEHHARCTYLIRRNKYVKAQTQIRDMPDVQDIMDAPPTLAV